MVHAVIHTPQNSQNMILLDAQGRRIPMVKSFNDETFEVELYVTSLDDNGKRKVAMSGGWFGDHGKWEPILVKTVILGAKLIPAE